jgi:hypothetical protein
MSSLPCLRRRLRAEVRGWLARRCDRRPQARSERVGHNRVAASAATRNLGKRLAGLPIVTLVRVPTRRDELPPTCFRAALTGPHVGTHEGDARSWLPSPRWGAAPLSDRDPNEADPSGAPVVLTTGVVAYGRRPARSLPYRPRRRRGEQHPELVGRGPGISQPGQAAASGDLRLGDQAGHVHLDGAG